MSDDDPTDDDHLPDAMRAKLEEGMPDFRRRHTQAGQSAHRAFVRLVTSGAEDGLTRGQLAATYLLATWQGAGTCASPHRPWIFLVNGGTAAPDPLFGLIRQPADPCGSAGGDPDLRENLCQQLRVTYQKRQRANRLGIVPAPKLYADEDRTFWALADEAFGGDPCSRYGSRHDRVLGWVNSDANQLLQRLEGPEEIALFRKDLLGRSPRLMLPDGVGGGLNKVPQPLAVTGTLDAAAWDGELVDGLLESGLPALFIPHAAAGPLKVTATDGPLGALARLLRAGFGPLRRPPPTPRCQPMIHPHMVDCEGVRRARLAHCPAAYAFYVELIVRELESLCLSLCATLNETGTPPEELAALHHDLVLLATRGITLGVECLAFHGYGVASFLPRGEVVRMLGHLRAAGTLSRRELQRKGQTLDAVGRDRLVACLAREGLVQVDGKRLTTVPLGGFITALATRPGLGEPELKCAGLPAKWEQEGNGSKAGSRASSMIA